MPHARKRHLMNRLKQEGSYWPAVGILGLRQSGKSTLLRDLFDGGQWVSLDDEESLEDATLSAKNFLSKLPRPLTIDEVQKAPKLFDALKFEIDRGKKPGQFFLTGSTQFSSRLGIRESLTGRIGLLYLYPMTLAEADQKEFEIKRCAPLHGKSARFPISTAFAQLECGGSAEAHSLLAIQKKFGVTFKAGWSRACREMLAAFSDQVISLKLHPLCSVRWERHCEKENFRGFDTLNRTREWSRRYLQALEDIFLLQKIPAHEESVGGDAWLPTDTGIAASIMGVFSAKERRFRSVEFLS